MSSTVSIKLSDAEKKRLQAKALERNVSLSKLIKDGIEKVLEEEGGESSCYDAMRDYFETPGRLMEGPVDYSTNKNYLGDLGKK